MNMYLQQQANALVSYLATFNNIKNIDVLIDRIKVDPSNKKKVLHTGDVLHAEFVKRFIENGIFEVTAVEIKDNGYDIDIKLGEHINIQVWFGASVSTHNIIKGKHDALGGVASDFKKDEDVINKKLKQLPHNEFGLLVCYNNHLGITFLPEWGNNIPINKAVVELYQTNYGNGRINEATFYQSENFKYDDLSRKVIHSLGFNEKEI